MVIVWGVWGPQIQAYEAWSLGMDRFGTRASFGGALGMVIRGDTHVGGVLQARGPRFWDWRRPEPMGLTGT